MRTFIIALSAALSVVAVSAYARALPPAQAQDAPQAAPPSPAAPPPGHAPHRLRDRFDAANTTHDGHLTLTQAQAGGMRMVARNFAAIDAGHLGYVTMPQIRSFARARRASRQADPPGQGAASTASRP